MALTEDYLQRLKPGRYAITYRSEPRLTAKCPWVGVIKLATYTGKLGLESHHEASVAQDPVFTPPAQPRSWGTRDGNLIRHQGKVYLELVDVEEKVVEFMDEEGVALSTDEIAPYVRESRRGEIIKTRTFNVGRIAAIKLHG